MSQYTACMSNDGGGNRKQAIPQTKDALEFLQTTAEDVATSRTIDSDVREEAITVAVRLAASLSAFGFEQAAEQASSVLATLQHAGLPQPERLQQQVAALRGSLGSTLEE